ncbi:hypothetical protein PHISCL_05199 [Aspergillus sclerotialis]|uniref:Uncharacterized protein n=1 Tax=Aspergillus sclerotialis TaxID=2070753 RepID=A0A3A2ZM51_9EURO|nr:hypothetical protein PHISCL_05199 [Aspergillus sclerotialis]
MHLPKATAFNNQHQKIRYTLGHVFASILILESAKAHNTSSTESNNARKSPTSRNLLSMSSLLYRTRGIRIFLSGLPAAITYNVAQYLIANSLLTLIFGDGLLNPVAEVLSSVLLSELHLHWTQATILAKPAKLTKLRHSKRRWKALAIPSLALAAAKVLMGSIPGYMHKATRIFAEGSDASAELSVAHLVSTEVLAALLVLAIRLFVFLPASAVLEYVEVSFLARTDETVVPCLQKKRGAKVAELLEFENMPLDFGAAHRVVRFSTCIWLLGLHLKKCAVVFCVDLTVWGLVQLLL